MNRKLFIFLISIISIVITILCILSNLGNVGMVVMSVVFGFVVFVGGVVMSEKSGRLVKVNTESKEEK